MEYKKKLIEVALPLEEINAASAREKSIRHGHPSTLHLWWARRPLAAARAVIWSSLVDDPSAHPEQFPTEEEQEKERQRLFGILTRLVKWENSNNEEVLNEAKEEILKSTDGNPPALLDPFAGGGAIPLEAQRLGLKAYASDLNPVAVMINKAMIEIPPRFAGQAPVNPEARAKLDDGKGWSSAHGLAEDVRYYGAWMKHEVFKKIGHLYPKVKDEHGHEHTVIDWIWARTVKCPNPACECEMPLIKSFYLVQKSGKEVWLKPTIVDNKVSFSIQHGRGNAPDCTVDQKINGARCLACGHPVGFNYLREEAYNGRMGTSLMAVCVEDGKEKTFICPDENYKQLLTVRNPFEYPTAPLPERALGFRVQQYGMKNFDDLFTTRQLMALSEFCNTIPMVQKQIEKDGGTDEYAKVVSIYLAFVIDRTANYGSSLCIWDNRGGTVVQTFGRQALSMIWNFAESNPFSNKDLVGNWSNSVNVIASSIANLPAQFSDIGSVTQTDAKTVEAKGRTMISTDPPYYDNIGYADLSDFFYMWLRRSLKSICPDLFNTLLTPKVEELIANPFRFGGGREEAQVYFENGMLEAFQRINRISCEDVPVTVYYAFKQNETDNESTSSTGWETMLSALINAGFSITGTWPIRTENPGGLRVNNRNALASSIILVCRKRPASAPTCTRRDFVNALKRELKPALEELQNSNIAPVDLAQSAIGPGMGVYSRFAKVLEADGTPMSVRSALQIINQELDLYFNEQEGNLDRSSRFCIDLYTQHAFNDMKFGEADELARAKNTSVSAMANAGALYAQKGIVRLMTREEIPDKVNPDDCFIWLLTQQLTHAMETGGVNACAKIVAPMFGSNAESAKALAYRLYTIADRKGWTQEAFAYNAFVVAWPDIQSRAAQLQSQIPEQLTL